MAMNLRPDQIKEIVKYAADLDPVRPGSVRPEDDLAARVREKTAARWKGEGVTTEPEVPPPDGVVDVGMVPSPDKDLSALVVHFRVGGKLHKAVLPMGGMEITMMGGDGPVTLFAVKLASAVIAALQAGPKSPERG